MADRYFVNGGVDSNWGSTSNWSTTDGGAGGSSVPTNADQVYFTANSPNCVVNTVQRATLGTDWTGYTNTIDMQNAISCVGGGFVLDPGMNVTGSAALLVAATCSLTSNGYVWPNGLTISLPASNTVTLTDDWEVLGNVILGPPSNTVNNINGFSITAHADVQIRPSAPLIGTTEIIMAGTGQLYGNTTSIVNGLPITFNTAGTITIPSGSTLIHRTGKITYIAGTIVTAGSTLRLTNTGCTIDTSGMTWDNLLADSSITTTLDSDLNAVGTVTIGNNSTVNPVFNGHKLNCSGSSFVHSSTTGTVSGTTEIHLLNTMTVSAPSLTTGRILNTTVLNPGAGKTITFDSVVNFDVGKLLYLSGDVITDAGTWTGGGSASEHSYTFVG